MSHLLETYSLQTGAKVSKPFIIKNFFPIPEKYITIHNSSGMGAKNYDYFQEVVDEIHEELSKNNIKIVQIGGADDRPINHCINLCGKTNYQQTAYIIHNSMTHIGNDSFPIHLASASDIPIIGLYSITTPKIAGPCFNSEEILNKKVFCFSPDYNGKKPSFNPNENPKKINDINIENIIQALEKILNINIGFNIKSIFKGDKYLFKVVEFVPDNLIRPDFAQNILINMRIDLLKDEVNENIIIGNLKNKKFNIFIKNSKKIHNLKALSAFKENIGNLFIDITNEGIDFEYIKALLNFGIKPIIYYKENYIDNDLLNNIKLKLINFNLKFVKHNQNNNKFNLSSINQEDLKKIYLKTNRVILSSGKIFLSELDYVNNCPSRSNSKKLSEIENIKELDKELEFCYLLMKEKK